MLNDDLSVLALQSMETLAEWWCLLNRWKWPDELPNPETIEGYVPGGRRSQIMRWIEDAIGMQQCLRAWNGDMSDEEFNDFWRGEFEGVEHARHRYRQRTRKEVELDEGG